MCYIHEDAKLVYLAHPRTASTATAHTLWRHMGFNKSHDHHARLNDHLSRHWDGTIDDTWTVFATVRNHFDVFNGWFHNANPDKHEQLSVAYLEWLIGSHPKYFVDPDRVFYHTPECSELLRYTTLQRDFDALMERAGIESVEIPVKNRTRHKLSYYETFTEAGRQWVEERYKEEMEGLGYEW